MQVTDPDVPVLLAEESPRQQSQEGMDQLSPPRKSFPYISISQKNLKRSWNPKLKLSKDMCLISIVQQRKTSQSLIQFYPSEYAIAIVQGLTAQIFVMLKSFLLACSNLEKSRAVGACACHCNKATQFPLQGDYRILKCCFTK